MSKSTVITLIGGLILLGFMLLQNNTQSNLMSNFDDFQSKRYESVKKQFADNGINEYQAHLIASAIREESSMLKSTVASNALMQNYMTTMSCLILLMFLGYTVKKSKNE